MKLFDLKRDDLLKHLDDIKAVIKDSCGLTFAQLGRTIRNAYAEGYEDGKAGRPQLEKSDPCPYCDGSETRFRGTSDYATYDYIVFESGEAFLIDADGDTIKIVACPICGRRLDVGGAGNG